MRKLAAVLRVAAGRKIYMIIQPEVREEVGSGQKKEWRKFRSCFKSLNGARGSGLPKWSCNEDFADLTKKLLFFLLECTPEKIKAQASSLLFEYKYAEKLISDPNNEHLDRKSIRRRDCESHFLIKNIKTHFRISIRIRLIIPRIPGRLTPPPPPLLRFLNIFQDWN